MTNQEHEAMRMACDTLYPRPHNPASVDAVDVARWDAFEEGYRAALAAREEPAIEVGQIWVAGEQRFEVVDGEGGLYGLVLLSDPGPRRTRGYEVGYMRRHMTLEAATDVVCEGRPAVTDEMVERGVDALLERLPGGTEERHRLRGRAREKARIVLEAVLGGTREGTQRSELADLRACGDQLQSEASRVAAWLEDVDVKMPYEVTQAALGIEDAVNRWTEIRRRSNV